MSKGPADNMAVDMAAANLLAQFKFLAAKETRSVPAAGSNTAKRDSPAQSRVSSPVAPPPARNPLTKPTIQRAPVGTAKVEPAAAVTAASAPSSPSSVPISNFIQQRKRLQEQQRRQQSSQPPAALTPGKPAMTSDRRRSRTVSVDGAYDLATALGPRPQVATTAAPPVPKKPSPLVLKPLAQTPTLRPLPSIGMPQTMTPLSAGQPIPGSRHAAISPMAASLSGTTPPLLVLEHHDWRTRSPSGADAHPASNSVRRASAASSPATGTDDSSDSDGEDSNVRTASFRSRSSVSADDNRTAQEQECPVSSRTNQEGSRKTKKNVQRQQRKSFVGETTDAAVVRSVLRKGFSWRQFPELEDFLRKSRPEYFKFSSLNYSMEQRRYNNKLTRDLLKLANEVGYVFEGFTFPMIRDRIRCYYKSYVQSLKKRKPLSSSTAADAQMNVSSSDDE